MREWLTVIIVLLIVAVVLDGLRRMRLSRRSAIRMPNTLKQQDTAAVDDVVDYGSELPSGGARVVNVRKAEDATERNSQIRQEAEYKRKNQLKSFRIPEQVSLNLDQQVPTLMESVADESQDQGDFQDDDRIEPIFATDDFDDTELDAEPLSDESRSAENSFVEERVEEVVSPPKTSDDDTPKPVSRPVSKPVTKPEPVTRPEPIEQSHDEPSYHEPELVLTINVMAPKGEQFPGAELLDIILDQGMRFGAMNIFHRHEQDDGDGEILYSMANIVVPGTFELGKMKTFTTPGVSFFMTLPMDANSTEAFEDMLTTAKIIGARLRGELKDENRSVLTPQTITHYRSKLQEFARKQLSKAPA